jgi:hypothetical protein
MNDALSVLSKNTGADFMEGENGELPFQRTLLEPRNTKTRMIFTHVKECWSKTEPPRFLRLRFDERDNYAAFFTFATVRFKAGGSHDPLSNSLRGQ